MHKYIGHFGYPHTKLLTVCKVCPLRPGAAYDGKEKFCVSAIVLCL